MVAEHRGQGIGTKVLRALIELAHEIFPNKPIQIRIREENQASRRIAEKCGGVYTGSDDTPESVSIRKLLEKLPEEGRTERGDLREVIERGRGAVRIYRV